MGHRSEPRLLVLHGLRLKAFADPAALSPATGLDVGHVMESLAELGKEGLVARREGRVSGWSLTQAGREVHIDLLQEELVAAGCHDLIAASYGRFRALNGELLSTCTAWQLQEVDSRQVANDHRNADYDAGVIARLSAVNAAVQPVCADLGEPMGRFLPYSGRLQGALDRVVAGELDWFTKPLIDSYHAVWFELHEDLLVTLGIERSKEIP